MTHSCLELLFLATLEDLARGRSKTLAKTQGAQRNQDHPESFLLRSGGSWRPWRTWREDEARHSRSLRSEREALLQGVKAFGGLASLAISARGRSKTLAKTQGAQRNQDHPESFLLRSGGSWRAWRSRREDEARLSRRRRERKGIKTTQSHSCFEVAVLGVLGGLGERTEQGSREDAGSARESRPPRVIPASKLLFLASLAISARKGRGELSQRRKDRREPQYPKGLEALDGFARQRGRLSRRWRDRRGTRGAPDQLFLLRIGCSWRSWRSWRDEKGRLSQSRAAHDKAAQLESA